MHKKLLIMLLLLSQALMNIFAVTYPAEFNINLNTEIETESYTLTLKYDDIDYSSPIVNATFSDSYTSDLFAVELSEGNEKDDLQFTIKIIPGTFRKSVDIGEDNFDTQFKPTPTIDNDFSITSSSYDENTQELTITSNIIRTGKNNSTQPLAKFYLGWQDNGNLPKVANGTYISTTIIEYTSEAIDSSSN
jgi:hypothetical protein